MTQDFVTWLQRELDNRGWGQADLVKSAQARGYKLAAPQITRIMKREQEGTVEVVIAIAAGFHLPREEVFRVRGWLLTEPEEVIGPGTLPEIVDIVRRLENMPPKIRGEATEAIKAVLDAIYVANTSDQVIGR